MPQNEVLFVFADAFGVLERREKEAEKEEGIKIRGETTAASSTSYSRNVSVTHAKKIVKLSQ